VREWQRGEEEKVEEEGRDREMKMGGGERRGIEFGPSDKLVDMSLVGTGLHSNCCSLRTMAGITLQ